MFRNIEQFADLFDIQVTVASRNGNKVFEESSYNHSVAWNGKNDQTDVPIGTYYYVVKKVPKQETTGTTETVTGTVSIIR